MSQNDVRSIAQMAFYGAVIGGISSCMGSLDLLITLRSACWGAIFVASLEAYFNSNDLPKEEP